ncbi:Obg family GTPase CgtA [Candidatus Portiera aleyrodidarum]|uniref:GTPase Obg n=1 Tax=Candidatus Portiera aleyrodidarum TaxID=91844 RepID=A0A8D9JPP0_9GAMM|nr:Obg family GTPase CgtA [Candidatus Portiera aleyrodidarum]CEI58667.1 GTPase Obg [Candidatus Portiera aleyrodidarum]
MQFIDEVCIFIEAGKGGNGCLSLRREKKGGPDGGNGGKGGNIFCIGDRSLNTLIAFNYKKIYKAENGKNGKSKKKNGIKGKDIYIKVPIGTILRDAQTWELIGDIIKHKQKIKVAKGGSCGIGNLKKIYNKNSSEIRKGTVGEYRKLYIELKLLADVGLLGLPNAGKSTLLRSVTSALPKVANYPFTTLRPYLGLVKLSKKSYFIMADVPGLIIGAENGVGLGLKFIKHFTRIRIIFQIIDLMTYNIIDSTLGIINEIKKIYVDIIKRPRWLVLNKLDKVPKYKKKQMIETIIKGLDWWDRNNVFFISAKKNYGCYELMKSAFLFLKRGNK